MWEHRCTVITKRGTRCRRVSTVATWCWGFGEGADYEHFDDGPSWVETCSHHQYLCSGEVARLEINPEGK